MYVSHRFEISLISVSSAANSKSGDILYKAQSQDEDALVRAAAQLHMVFINRNANIIGKHHSHLLS